MKNNDFYRAFEDKYRGSRELIKNRVSVYLPFVLPLKSVYEDVTAIDIGCGRGEWLELLKENSIDAVGVDLDSSMLTACKDRNFNVENRDGVTYLQELPDESVMIVSAFHVVEHISFEALQTLVSEALRVLKDGGILILETPNPENIKVATENFYVDPTHQKPIPSNLLSFLPEFYGFGRTKVLRLQESKKLLDAQEANLMQVLDGVSPDYAVVAQKGVDDKVLKLFDDAFKKEYGLSLNTLINKYENRLHKIEFKINEKVAQLEVKVHNAQLQADEAKIKTAEAEAKVNEALNLYNIVVNSNSWKITKPLRLAGKGARWFVNGSKAWLTFSETSRPRRVYNRLFYKSVNDSIDIKDHQMIYGCIEANDKPLIVADMYVLGQGVKTGIYRVCDEIYKRLDKSDKINFNYYLNEPFIEKSEQYLKENNFRCSDKRSPLEDKINDIDFFIAPFGLAPYDIVHKRNVKHVHIIYDLIAIKHPEYFTQEGAKEVKDIIDSLNSETVIFAISKSTKKELLEYKKELSQEQITVIPLAADEKFIPSLDKGLKIEVCKKYNIPHNKPYILSLATLEIRKNIETTIEAFNHYLINNPESELNLVLAGMSGWKLEKLQKKIEQYEDIKDRIIFTGFIEDDDLPTLYSNALAFVYMSRYEGFGLPPLEAMACGVPVITADNSSLPEVVADAGFMFDCDDFVSVSNTIKKLYDDKSFRDKYKNLSLQRAKMFSWDKTTDIILDRLKSENQKKVDSWPEWVDSLPFKKESKKIEGGLRTKGIVKQSKPNKPLITYVTVVWNNEKDIRRTIESVQNQTYDNVEHILLDGASTDNTLKIIKEYEDKVDYFVSEKDDGLYDALNKAIPLSNGDLICVLNSDDWLPKDAAQIVVDNYNGNENELVLGTAKVDTIIWHPSTVSNCSYFTVANCCHNAIYATKGTYKRSGEYDKTYKIAADFKWIMSCYDSGCKFTYLNDIVVNYSLGGISSDTSQHILESKRVIKDKFTFLDSREIDIINYAYYTWREELNHKNYTDIDFDSEIKELYIKYNFSQEFLDALKCNGLRAINSRLIYEARYTSVKKKIKALLKNSPKSYLYLKRVYHFVKRSKNG